MNMINYVMHGMYHTVWTTKFQFVHKTACSKVYTAMYIAPYSTQSTCMNVYAWLFIVHAAHFGLADRKHKQKCTLGR